MPVKVKSTNRQDQTSASSKGKLGLRGQEPDPQFGKTIRVSKQAPGFMFFMGGLGICGWGIASFTQVITTVIAFVLDSIHNEVYKHMSVSQQQQALPVIIVASILLAILVQIFVNIAAVRVDLSWKKGGSQLGEGATRLAKLRAGAIEVSHQPMLILVLGGAFFVANGIGDYGFVYSFTDSWVFLFFWGLALSVCGTILLPESTEYIWSGLTAKAETASQSSSSQATA